MTELDPDEALSMLFDGNVRYAVGDPIHPNQSVDRRAATAEGQEPLAVIVGCSDSRVPPEIIFDQGIGDLFVVRLAGNVVDDAALASIEYAVQHLGTRLVVVLGHERCGAVEAAMKSYYGDDHIGNLVDAIKPAVIKATAKEGDMWANAVRHNVLLVVDRLRSSGPVLSTLATEGKLKVVGAYYDLDEGTVELVH
jgi:carbonic anhydrase